MDATQFKKTYTLGNDITINRLGYGAMRITGKGVWGPPENKAEAIRVLRRAVALGINFIDTADSYGPNISEELIAEALHPYPSGLTIATKGGFLRTGPDQWRVNSRPDHLREALEGSLKRLKLEQIPLYQLHRVDPKVPLKESLGFLKQAQQQGLIRHIGLSEVTIDQIKTAQEVIDVVSVQNQYGIDNRKWELVLNYCRDNNIAFIPWYPLHVDNATVRETLSGIARKHNATSHQIALSWLLYHAPNIIPIPGTSKVSHLEENFKAFSLGLSKEDLNDLEELQIEATRI